jgi:phenylalanyl-tRNA synthetase beta chain
LEWLKDYVDISLSGEELADLLTATGTAVDAVERVEGRWKGPVVAEVVSVSPHPGADRLRICKVKAGEKTWEVVCGAPNVRPGMKSAFAPPGSILPGGREIREVEIRGVVSRGMLLSEMELGLSEEAEGIMELDGDLPAGRDLAEALGFPDTVLDLEITPNRPDCLSMVGVAREVAALTGEELRLPSCEVTEGRGETSELVKVEIMDSDLCSRYAARVIEEVRVAPSPWWVRRRLKAAGVRPINNIVDVTNYVMLELGQPLHAFDYDLLRDGHIIVRRARAGEKLVTLDGVARTMGPDDLLICDPSGPVALAGVMGGENTEVNASTRRVLLESAHFDPPGIMRTSRRHEIASEASYRFERGVDPSGCARAADRAAMLMHTVGGGTVLRGVVDVVARETAPVFLSLRVKRAGKIIGVDLSTKRAGEILSSLGLKVKEAGGKGAEMLEVEVPTFRPDLTREIDLVEEIARLYGYDAVPSTLPVTSHNVGFLTREQKLRRRVREVLAGAGLREVINYSFVSPRWREMLDPGGVCFPARPLELRNPLSEEASEMRTTLLFGLLENLRFNVNRRNTDVFIFEMGRVFIPLEGEELPRESLRLGLLLCGRWRPKNWGEGGQAADFYTLKGVLQVLERALHLEEMKLRRAEFPFLRPAQSCVVMLGGEEAGWMGALHPSLSREADLPEEVLVAELDMETLERKTPQKTMYREIPRFPAVQLDVAIVVPERTEAEKVEEVIRKAGGELLRRVKLFDLYRGDQVGEGMKSLAYSLTFFALDRTLTDREVLEARDRIIREVEKKLGGRLR